MSRFLYYVVFNHHDSPVEVIRVNTKSLRAIVIAPSSSEDFGKQSCLFENENPRLSAPYCFQLLQASAADHPAIGEWLDACNSWAERRGSRKRGKQSYSALQQAEVISLLSKGESVRTVGRLTNVAKSTVHDWKAMAVR